jgi:NADPH-dependent 7-cyano-7-deazaguanine reductase QueF
MMKGNFMQFQHGVRIWVSFILYVRDSTTVFIFYCSVTMKLVNICIFFFSFRGQPNFEKNASHLIFLAWKCIQTVNTIRYYQKNYTIK